MTLAEAVLLFLLLAAVAVFVVCAPDWDRAAEARRKRLREKATRGLVHMPDGSYMLPADAAKSNDEREAKWGG